LPQVGAGGSGFKGPNPTIIADAGESDYINEYGHVPPTYLVEDCKVYNHKLPRMITVMRDKLQVNVQRQQGQRVRTISLQRHVSRREAKPDASSALEIDY